MTHFIGWLFKDPPPPEDAQWTGARQDALAWLTRPDLDAPSTYSDGRVWLAASLVDAWNDRNCIVHDGTGTVGVVAGDPLFAAHGQACSRDESVRQAMAALGQANLGALQQAHGMFAAAAWNAARHTMVLATDKLANRPLYLLTTADCVVFATSLRLLKSIKSLATHLQPDPQGMAEIVYLGQPLGRRTAFVNVSVLRPGEAVEIDLNLAIQRERYHDWCQTKPVGLDWPGAVHALHTVFAQAVRDRVIDGPQEAFLSGGMDSRAVVAELVDQGQSVSTFCTAFRGSEDVVVGELIAAKLGTQHLTSYRTPADRVKSALDPFALYARQHFDSTKGAGPRLIWSGDGGSVGMGHVYLTPDQVEAAAQKPDRALAVAMFPVLATRRTRQLGRGQAAQMAEMAISGVLEELESVSTAAPDRRLFLFYLHNDQARHLYDHFEHILDSRVEMLAPFFDGRLVELITALPSAWFVQHRLYNAWLQGFRCAAGDVYWQAYPGHLPCPHAAPEGIKNQWNSNWYAGPDVRRMRASIAGGLLTTNCPRCGPYTSRLMLQIARWTCLAGSSRFNHEIDYSRDIMQALCDPR